MKKIQTMRKNLRLLREEKNWSIQKLSQISGINMQVLTEIEKDGDLDVDLLYQLCLMYGIKKLHDIFLPIDKQPKQTEY